MKDKIGEEERRIRKLIGGMKEERKGGMKDMKG